LTKPRSASIGRASAAVTVALALAACATQLEPPVVVTSATPAAAMTPAPRIEGRIEFNASPSFKLIEGPAPGQFTASAAEVTLRVDDVTRMRGSADWLNRTEDAMLFEGNVRFTFDGTSITASRALVKTEPDGGTTVQLDDATVRYDADATNLAE
jgi:hypothetical protein